MLIFGKYSRCTLLLRSQLFIGVKLQETKPGVKSSQRAFPWRGADFQSFRAVLWGGGEENTSLLLLGRVTRSVSPSWCCASSSLVFLLTISLVTCCRLVSGPQPWWLFHSLCCGLLPEQRPSSLSKHTGAHLGVVGGVGVGVNLWKGLAGGAGRRIPLLSASCPGLNWEGTARAASRPGLTP